MYVPDMSYLEESRKIERKFVVSYLRFCPTTVSSNILCNKYDFMGARPYSLVDK
jgi:hypothetical protein